MYILTPTLSPSAWLLVAGGSLLVVGGSICMLIATLRRPKIHMSDSFEEEKTRSDYFRRTGASTTRKEIFEGMAQTTSSGHESPEPTALALLQPEPDITTTHSKPDFDLFEGMTDTPDTPQFFNPTPPPTTEPKPELHQRQEQGHELMVDRPDVCPFCDCHPLPDYNSHDVDGGTIFCCPTCNCIVYIVPKDIAHRYKGMIYHAPAGKPFTPPEQPQFEKTALAAVRFQPSPSLDIDNDGMVIDLFRDIVDQNNQPH